MRCRARPASHRAERAIARHRPVLPDRSGRRRFDRRHGGDARLGHQCRALRHDEGQCSFVGRGHRRRLHRAHGRAGRKNPRPATISRGFSSVPKARLASSPKSPCGCMAFPKRFRPAIARSRTFAPPAMRPSPRSSRACRSRASNCSTHCRSEAATIIRSFRFPRRRCCFVEFHGTSASVAEQSQRFGEIAAEFGGGPFVWATRPEERTRLWQARHDVYWASLTLRPGARPFATDVCVPISRLADCVEETQRDIAEAGLVAPIVGHVGDGNFHVSPLVDMDDPADIARAEAFSSRLVRRALAMDGTCTGEHGVGQKKIQYVEEEYSAATLDLMRRIKQAFDPGQSAQPGQNLATIGSVRRARTGGFRCAIRAPSLSRHELGYCPACQSGLNHGLTVNLAHRPHCSSLVLLISALTAALIGPYFVDWSKQRAAVEAQLSQVLSERVAVKGAIDLKLLPSPYITLSQVEIADPKTGGVLFSCDEMELALGLTSLVRGANFDLRRPLSTIQRSISHRGADGGIVLPKLDLAKRSELDRSRQCRRSRRPCENMRADGRRRTQASTALILTRKPDSLLGPFKGSGRGAGFGRRESSRSISRPAPSKAPICDSRRRSTPAAGAPRSEFDGALALAGATSTSGVAAVGYSGAATFSGLINGV